LPPGIQQPARQIAASSRTYPAARSTGISKTTLTLRPVANIRTRSLRSLPVSETSVQCEKAFERIPGKRSHPREN
jgi:hypothetical protein